MNQLPLSWRWSFCAIAVTAGLMNLVCPAVADENDELVAMVLSLLSEKDKDLRAVALEQVRTQAKGEAATKRFADELPKLSPEVQVELLSALRDRGDAAARAAVVPLVSSQDEAVRVAAVRALGPLGNEADVQKLTERLASGTEQEQKAAKASLVRLEGSAVNKRIAEALDGADGSATRVALIEILLTRRATDCLDHFVSLAVADDSAARQSAMAALGELGTARQLAGMVQGVLAATKGKERDAAERCVAQVCLRLSPDASDVGPLLLAYDALGEQDRLAAFPMLGRVGGAAMLKIIETAIADTDSGRHEAGLRALFNWPNASVAPRLIELASNDPHPEHRTVAVSALIRVAPLKDGRSDSERLELMKKAMSMCSTDDQRNTVLKRLSAIRTIEALRYLMPYLDDPKFAPQACESIVELAHHRGLREPNKAEFDKALDHVLATSKDATVIDRANRYKKGQTWVRPKPAAAK